MHNRFGMVTTLSVRYNEKKNLFAGIAKENLPMRHVTSIKLETSRHAIWGAILGVIGLIIFLAGFQGGAGAVFFGAIILALGVFLIWGWPKVVVYSGGQPHGAVSWPWTRGEADTFKKAVDRELSKRG